MFSVAIGFLLKPRGHDIYSQPCVLETFESVQETATRNSPVVVLVSVFSPKSAIFSWGPFNSCEMLEIKEGFDTYKVSKTIF